MKTKILFTDLDGTLITPKGNRKFPKDEDDWAPIPESIKFLKEYQSNGYKLILVTNQAGISKGYLKEQDITNKIIKMEKSLGISFHLKFIATSMNSDYRKPKVSKLKEDLHNSGIIVDEKKSLMLGDAGGRKMDHSSDDKKFAENLGIPFIHVDDLGLLNLKK